MDQRSYTGSTNQTHRCSSKNGAGRFFGQPAGIIHRLGAFQASRSGGEDTRLLIKESRGSMAKVTVGLVYWSKRRATIIFHINPSRRASCSLAAQPVENLPSLESRPGNNALVINTGTSSLILNPNIELVVCSAVGRDSSSAWFDPT